MRGMSANAVLRTIVETVRADSAEPAAGSASTAAELTAKLRRSGADAREVRIESAADVDMLSLPAALLMADGSWLAIPRRGRLIGEDGECRAGAHEIHAAGIREAVECIPAAAVRPSLTRFLVASARGHASKLATLAAAAFAVRVLFAFLPELTRMIVDQALPNGASGLVEAIALAIVVVAITQALLQRFRSRLLIFIRAAMDTATGRAFLRHVMHQPFAAVAGQSRGDMIQSVNGVQIARDAAFDQLLPALFEIAPAVVLVALLANESPLLSLITFGGAAALIIVQLAVAMRQTALQRAEVTLQARHRSLFLEALSGIPSIKSLGAEEPLAQRWSALQSREVALALQRRRAGTIADVSAEVLRQATIAAILVCGGIGAISGHTSLGSLVASVQLCAMVMASAGSLASAAGALLQVRAQLDRTNHFLRSPHREGSRIVVDGAARVVLDDVWFRYPHSAAWVLSGSSATVEAGQTLHLASSSGSGKTTLLRLLAGLYEPERGSVRINGIDAASVDGVAYLPQFPHLFAGSLLDNLRIFSGGAPIDRILSLAVETGLDDWVRSMPMAYDTVIATGGSNISGGQRQLITLTAVLASDRPLLLLDEPMANLDRESAERIWRIAARERKTIIYAEHNAVTERSSAA